MELTRLSIDRIGWGKDKDKLMGEISFENQEAKVTLKLSHEKSQRMLEIVAEQIVENAQETSSLLINNIVHLPLALPLPTRVEEDDIPF